MQNSAIYKTQFTNRSMTIASVDLTASGITDMRVHMQGSNQTIYMDNFGILTEEVSFGMYDFYDSTWTAFFDKAGGATWTVAGAQDDNTNMVLNYTHSSTSEEQGYARRIYKR